MNDVVATLAIQGYDISVGIEQGGRQLSKWTRWSSRRKLGCIGRRKPITSRKGMTGGGSKYISPGTVDNRKVWYNVGRKQKRRIEGSLSRRKEAGQDGFMPRKRLEKGLWRLGWMPGQSSTAPGWLIDQKTAPRGPVVKMTVE